MTEAFYKLLPFLFSLLLSQLTYNKIDKRYKITDKLSLRLPIRSEWKASFIIFFMLIFILIIGILGIYIVKIPTLLYAVISGLLTGITINMANKIATKHTPPPKRK